MKSKGDGRCYMYAERRKMRESDSSRAGQRYKYCLALRADKLHKSPIWSPVEWRTLVHSGYGMVRG